MQHRLKAIVAAAVLAAGGAAHAALDTGENGNGSLAFLAFDAVGSPISIVADLNFNINSFLPTSSVNAPGTTISWNFLSNTLTVNGVAQAGTFNWSAPFASFMSVAQSADLMWAVVSTNSFDNHYLTTGNPTQTQINQQTLASTSLMGLVDQLYAANAGLGTHASSTAGASTATSGTAYVGNPGSFGTTGNWASNALKWNSLAVDGGSNAFEYVESIPRTGATTLANVTVFGNPNAVNAPGSPSAESLFSFNSATGTLTWVTTPVPEPASLAMFAAGLAAVGFVGRRRRG